MGLLLVAVAWLLSTDALVAQSPEMRIESFVMAEKEKASENLTLFFDGRVYDFRLNPKSQEVEEIVIFDPRRQQAELFDIAKKTRTSVDQQTVVTFLASLKTDEQIRKRDPLLFDAKLAGEYDSTNQTLLLKDPESDRLTYKVTGAPPSNPNMLQLYYEFVDWYTRMNALHPGTMPPFARLQVNDEMRKLGIMAEKVERTYSSPQAFSRKHSATSQHWISWNLTPKDHERIRNIDRYVSFERVEVARYFGLIKN